MNPFRTTVGVRPQSPSWGNLPWAKLATSLIALGALLGTAAQASTSIAELPLKASVLAKPNVIWGLDDSGSMDSEVMLPTNDGAFWWDHTNANGWNASGVLNFNAPGDATTRWRKMVYLFPNGTGTGRRAYNDATNDHFAIPPTAQFAFLRSPDFNPLYFNPEVTYKPWSPAFFGGSTRTFANSPPTAARSHPHLGSTTHDLTVDIPASTNANEVFMVLPGMVIPAGTRTCSHTGTCTWIDETAARTLGANSIRRLSMAYFPATYYRNEACSLNTDGSCVAAPNGSTLKRYEIRRVNYGSDAEYNAAIQNFANWFTYYRKRKLMTNAAVGQVLEPLTGLRMGLVRFNSHSTVTMFDTDATAASANRLRITGLFYEVDDAGGTPTRQTLNYIGQQYINNTNIIQFACQRNNAFIVTDGFANANITNPPAYNAATWGTGAPYQTTFAGTLADIALSYYTINLRPALATGRVPPTATDTNPNLHMNTYGLTLGAKGTIWQNEDTPVPTNVAAWPNPDQNRSPTAVDDLWHATINGRGKKYGGSSFVDTAASIRAGLLDILSQKGAQSGVAVATVNLVRGDNQAYFGVYDPSGWKGDVTANPISQETAVVSTTPNWSASQKLLARDWTTRVIATQKSDGSGTRFITTEVGTIVNPGGVYGDTTEVMSYLRGDRTHEGTKFRQRTGLLGAIINSEPVVSLADQVLYVASGEGMLHAFDTAPGTNAGQELWAFVPRAVLPDIGQTSQRTYSFKTQLDGSPVVGTIGGGKKILVAGMGAAGRGYYALDVSSPRNLTEEALATKVMWEFPAAGDAAMQAKVGQTLGQPVILQSPDNGWVVLVTSGYNNTHDGKGRMWMLNANTGAVIHEFEVPAGTLAAEAGLAHVVGFDDGTAKSRYAYGGDLLGNLWRFDLKAKDTPHKVAELKGPAPASDPQPITVPPELTSIGSHRVIVVPTGRILNVSDFGNTKVQSLYVIKDGATLTSPRSVLKQQTYTKATDSLSNTAVDWTTDRGWFVDLPAGEQGNTRPAIVYGGVSLVTNTNGGNDCLASSRLYFFDVKAGTKYAGATFIGTPVSDSANATPVRPVISKDGKIRFLVQDTDGNTETPNSASPRAIPAGKVGWREIRRQ